LIKSPLNFFKLLWYLKDADVINPRIPDMTGVYGWMIGKLYKKPMFISLQSDITESLENENSTKLKGIMKKGLFAWLRFYLIFERIIMKNEVAFPQGEKLVDKYSKINPKAIPWISTALDDKDVVLRKKEISLKEKEKIILLNIARLTRQKQQIDLIKMLHILHKNGYKNVYLKIVGKRDENIFNELNQKIKEYNLLNFVEFQSPVNHGADLWKIFDNADIFVFSSIWEGTPKVLLEAMARSLPIVSTNVGGIPSVIKDNYNGKLCNKENPECLAQKVQDFIKMDLNDLNQYIKNGFNEVKKYTLSAQKKVLIDGLKKYGIIQ
jgi:glycosyltransferase involved in cell wall biosynthesis